MGIQSVIGYELLTLPHACDCRFFRVDYGWPQCPWVDSVGAKSLEVDRYAGGDEFLLLELVCVCRPATMVNPCFRSSPLLCPEYFPTPRTKEVLLSILWLGSLFVSLKVRTCFHSRLGQRDMTSPKFTKFKSNKLPTSKLAICSTK